MRVSMRFWGSGWVCFFAPLLTHRGILHLLFLSCGTLIFVFDSGSLLYGFENAVKMKGLPGAGFGIFLGERVGMFFTSPWLQQFLRAVF